MRRQQLTYLLTFYRLYSASDLHENLSEHSSPSNLGHVPKKAYTITKSKICVVLKRGFSRGAPLHISDVYPYTRAPQTENDPDIAIPPARNERHARVYGDTHMPQAILH